MFLTIEKKIIAIIIVFTVVGAAIVATVIWPTTKQILSTQNDTFQLRLDVEKKNHQAVKARAARTHIAEIKQTVETFPNHLFFRGDELKLITTLEALAARHHVSERVKNSNLDNLNNQELTLSLAITGNYYEVLSYLSDLEALPYFLNIQSLHLTAAVDPAKKTTQTILDIDLHLYVSA